MERSFYDDETELREELSLLESYLQGYVICPHKDPFEWVEINILSSKISDLSEQLSKIVVGNEIKESILQKC